MIATIHSTARFLEKDMVFAPFVTFVGRIQRHATLISYVRHLTFTCTARMILAILLLVVGSSVLRVANAHEVRPVIGTFTVDDAGNAHLELSLNLEAAILGIGADHKDTEESPDAQKYNDLRGMTPDELQAVFERFKNILVQRVEVMVNLKQLNLNVVAAEIPEVGDIGLARISKVTLGSMLPDNPRQLAWRFDRSLGDTVMRFRDIPSNKIVRAEVITAGQPGGPVDISEILPQGRAEVFATYVKQGFLHIIPKGLDHILFVVGLFLLSTRMSVLLWQISAFTLAHTVTLAMASTGAVSVSPSIVEPLIALSIVYIGVENVMTDRLRVWRPPIVFAFGLLHGLGFAGVLGEIGLPENHFWTSLIAFNLGVEFGQLAVIALAAVALGWAMRLSWYRKIIAVPASLAISAVALYWAAERMSLFNVAA